MPVGSILQDTNVCRVAVAMYVGRFWLGCAVGACRLAGERRSSLAVKVRIAAAEHATPGTGITFSGGLYSLLCRTDKGQ